MSGGAKILPYYTYNDWINWEGRWEIIDGIPHAMSPAPILKHQLIANNLGVEFGIALKKCKLCKALQASDYKITDDTIIQPDFLIVCKGTSKKYVDYPPALVEEILSPSTALKDRHTKFGIYEKEKVGYYLMIDPQKEEVEIYVLSKEGVYELNLQGKEIGFTFSFDDNCTAEIDFSEIW